MHILFVDDIFVVWIEPGQHANGEHFKLVDPVLKAHPKSAIVFVFVPNAFLWKSQISRFC